MALPLLFQIGDDTPTPTPAAIPFIPYVPRRAAAEYELWLASPDNVLLKILTTAGPQADVLRLESQRVVNVPGLLNVVLANQSYLDLLQEDCRLYVRRRLPEGIIIDTDTFYFVRDWTDSYDSGAYLLELDGVFSASFILDSRIVAYAAGSSQSSKSGAADDLMKAVIRENFGSLATNSDRIVSDLDIEPDEGAGPTISDTFARENCLAVLQDLFLQSYNLGSPIYFDVDSDFVFRTYPGQRGNDRGLSSDNPLIFSIENGIISKIRRSRITSAEKNFIYAGGQGEEENRLVGTASDDERIYLSPYNRREMWLEHSNIDSSSLLESKARAQLQLSGPREVWDCEIVDSEAIRYGRDWGFGDRIVLNYNGVRDALVNEVRLLLENGQETIGAKLVVV